MYSLIVGGDTLYYSHKYLELYYNNSEEGLGIVTRIPKSGF